MANVVGEIVIDVTADVGAFIRNMAKGEGAMAGLRGAANRMGSGLQSLGGKATDLGKKMSIISAGITAVGVAAFALTRSAATLGDAIGDSAAAAGMSSTAFQEYGFALKEAAALSDEEFASSMTKLNKTLGEARAGSESAIKAFEAIGVSQTQIADASFTTDRALAAFIAKMEATEDPALAAAMASDLFGKAGAGIGAALSGVPGQVGALVDRARELGVVMGPDAIKAAGDFDKKMGELGTQFEAVKIQLASVLLPVIVNELIPALQEKVIPAIQGVIVELGEWITWFQGLDPAIQSFVGAITAAFAVGGPVLLAIGFVSTAIGGLVAASGPIGLLVAAAGLITAAWLTWGDDIKAAIEPAITWMTDKFEMLMGILDAFLGKIKAMATAVTDFFTVSQQEIDQMDFGGASGLGFGEGGSGGLGIDPGGGFGGGGAGGAAGGQMMGAAIVNGAFMGAVNAMNEKRDAFAAVFSMLPQIARETLGIQSPSTVFAEIGQFVGEGLANGITGAQAMVGQAVSALGTSAVDASNGMVNDILGGMDTLLAGSKKGGAALAWVNTLIGASQEIKKGTFGFASMAAVIAKGAALVSAIKGGGDSGRSRGGSVGGGTTAAAAAPQQATQNLGITFVSDPFGIGERVARDIAARVNQAQRNGTRLNVSVKQ